MQGGRGSGQAWGERRPATAQQMGTVQSPSIHEKPRGGGVADEISERSSRGISGLPYVTSYAVSKPVPKMLKNWEPSGSSVLRHASRARSEISQH